MFTARIYFLVQYIYSLFLLFCVFSLVSFTVRACDIYTRGKFDWHISTALSINLIRDFIGVFARIFFLVLVFSSLVNKIDGEKSEKVFKCIMHTLCSSVIYMCVNIKHTFARPWDLQMKFPNYYNRAKANGAVFFGLLCYCKTLLLNLNWIELNLGYFLLFGVRVKKIKNI